MSGTISASVPVLASLNLDESREFYTTSLGFALRLQAADYLIVEREGVELHFWLCPERYLAENTSCYLRSPNTQALYDEFKSRGLQLAPPHVRGWGMKELYVIDPHGNLLKFGEPL